MENKIDKIKFYPNQGVLDAYGVIKKYPVLNMQNRDRLLLGKFTGPEGQQEYAVFGKMTSKITSDNVFDFATWLTVLDGLVNLDVSGADPDTLERRHRGLTVLRQSEFAKGTFFTQEGFDLIMGKQFSNMEHKVIRTVVVPMNEVDGQSGFSEWYDQLHGDYRFDSLNPFLPFDDYNKAYFLNREESRIYTQVEALTYAAVNVNRWLAVLKDKSKYAARDVESTLSSLVGDEHCFDSLVGGLDAAIELSENDRLNTMQNSDKRR